MKNKRITITGGKGFLGSRVVQTFQEHGYQYIFSVEHREYDLVKLGDVKQMYEDTKPDIVIHLAARVGGIGFNRENPATLFYENLMMSSQVFHEGFLRNIDKFVAIGTICSYPKFTPVPFKEEDLWDGYPEETNAPYGLAKRMTIVQSQAYRQQYGFNSIVLLSVNLYGPGDRFDPQSSHVIPALIKKCLEAIRNRDEEIIAWGTGTATREFCYVDDAAEAIMLATERYNKSEPINIGTGFEISIKNLVELIVELTEFQGRITWDTSKPEGQPRRMLDTTKAMQEFEFTATTNFKEGLTKTIEWYKQSLINSNNVKRVL